MAQAEAQEAEAEAGLQARPEAAEPAQSGTPLLRHGPDAGAAAPTAPSCFSKTSAFLEVLGSRGRNANVYCITLKDVPEPPEITGKIVGLSTFPVKKSIPFRITETTRLKILGATYCICFKV